MKRVIAWAIKNSPAMNTLLVASMLVGAISMVIMRREVFPNFALDILLISVPFPGATPDEVEEGICQKIESAVYNVDGVKKTTAVARENFGYVILELDSNVTDVQRVLNDVRSQVDQISTFPPRAEDPEVKQIIFRAPAITVGILGPEITEDMDPLEAELQLRELAEEIRKDILELRPVPPANPLRRMFSFLYQPKGPAVSGADIVAEKPYEIAVEIPEDTLRQFGLSLETAAQILRSQNIEVPGGKMETASQELLLRGDAKRERGQEIAEIAILTKPNGDVVTVGDLGQVVDGFAETTSRHRINGRPGMAITVTKTSNEDLFTIVDAVKKYAQEKKIPTGYEIISWSDISEDVRDRIDLLQRNGLQGLILVFLVLAVFLELRLAFWVAVGIPVSILGAGFILLMTGNTLNMLTMFAFLMALGIVVDDAIVIGENIYTKRQEGLGPIAAAIEGTWEVLPSVFASVSTTIIAFLPLMFVSGIMGKFIAVMPVAVIAMLVISLIESTFILPSHLAHSDNLFLRFVSYALYVFKPLVWVFHHINMMADRVLTWFIERIYGPVLHYSLHNKPVIISLALAYALVAAGLIAGGVAPFGLFPKIDGRDISATIAFPTGTSSTFAINGVAELKKAIQEIEQEHIASGKRPFIKNLYEKIGEIGDTNLGPTGITSGSHVGTIEVQLVPADERDITSTDLISEWRKRVPKIPGTDVLKFGTRSMGPGGNAIEFKLLADDESSEFLEPAAEACKEALAQIVGVKDIEDDRRPGKTEFVLRLNELGLTLGLNEAQLANTIRSIYFGEEVQRLQRGRHEVKLIVRYPKDERQSLEAFENIRIRDNNGTEWPLLEVVEIDQRVAASEINRLNQRRSITVIADVDDKQANAVEINQTLQASVVPAILNEFKEKHGANLTVDWEGEQAQNMESLASMFAGFFVALLCMFVLLTLEFRSYMQPIIIMSIIPFGWLGAILGHAILGLQLTLFSFFGLIALTGVVVNDSIVLVDFINHRIRDGLPLVDALMSAGKRRFRPILLTSLTTVAGLFPMLLETSLQAQVLIPMAASLIFGLMTGTALILILVPVFYSIYGWVLARFNFDLHDDAHAEATDRHFEPGFVMREAGEMGDLGPATS